MAAVALPRAHARPGRQAARSLDSGRGSLTAEAGIAEGAAGPSAAAHEQQNPRRLHWQRGQHGVEPQQLSTRSAAASNSSAPAVLELGTPGGATSGDDAGPGPRWGHSAAYLPGSQVVLFVGGQVPSWNNASAGMVTNDVFAFDVSALNSSAAGNSSAAWSRLSSVGLPPHAFAARAVTHDPAHLDERLWIIGGATSDCSQDAPVYSWSAPAGAWRNGTWSAPAISSNASVPVRRRGARAFQVPSELGTKGAERAAARQRGGTSFMVIGGTADGSTCAPAANETQEADYFGLDIWTGNGTTAGRSAAAAALPADDDGMSIRSLALEASMKGMPLVDYATVLLPANASTNSSDRVLFLGGRDANHTLASLASFWALDLASGRWEQWNATSAGETQDLPTGRVGHTASRMPDGRILVHGGYTTLEQDGVRRNATNEAFVLDPSVTPARWSRITGFGSAPARAYHTAVWAGEVLVLGFGQAVDGFAPANHTVARPANSTNAADANGDVAVVASSAVHFLDTAAPGGWRWSDSIADVVSARMRPTAVATETPTTEALPTVTPVAPVAVPKVAAAPKKQAAPEAAASPAADDAQTEDSVSDATPVDSSSQTGSAAKVAVVPDAPVASTAADAPPSSDSSSSSSATKSGAIAGGILGAAALAATLGGLYAAHKRREAARDDDGLNEFFGKDGEMLQRPEERGPPVSSLWLSQPMAWAATAGKGLKRQATNASEAFRARRRRNSATPSDASDPFADEYTSPSGARGFEVLRNVPARGRLSMRRQQREAEASLEEATPRALPTAFITSLVADDEDQRALYEVGRTVGGGRGASGLEAQHPTHSLLTPPMEHYDRSMNRSSESLASVGSISHFSYPYLAAMHRPSLAGASSSAGASPRSNVSGSYYDSAAVSPRDGARRDSLGASGMSPSESYWPTMPGAAALTPTWQRDEADARDAVFVSQLAAADGEELEEMCASDVADAASTALDAPSDPAAWAAGNASPMFPWERPTPSAVPKLSVPASAPLTSAPFRAPLRGVEALRLRDDEQEQQQRASSSRRARRSHLRVINDSAA